MPSDRSYKRYLALMAAAVGIVLATMIAFNLAMDPYYIWRWTWAGNREKPWNSSPQTLALEATLHRPTTIFVGRSHVALGFDPHSPAMRGWERPYLYSGMINAGAGADFEFQNQALATMSATGRLKQALIELDPRQFIACNGTAAEPASVLDGLETSLLESALGKSVGVFRNNLGHGVGTDDQYLRHGSGPVYRLPESAAHLEATLKKVSRDMFVTDEPCAAPDPTLGLARLDRLVALARSRHVALTFFIAPLHPEMVMLMQRFGTWAHFEGIKRRLAAYSAHQGVTIWDFSAAELAKGPSAAAEFSDAVHYVPAVGDRILSRMHAGPEAGGDFGQPLTPATIEATILEDRRAIAACATQAAATTG